MSVQLHTDLKYNQSHHVKSVGDLHADKISGEVFGLYVWVGHTNNSRSNM